jgi:hypothetical protein
MRTPSAYLEELSERARAVLGTSLVGVYAGGSYALDAYEQRRSDVDVAIVVEAPLPHDTKQALVQATRHENLHCPSRGLELVVYDRAAAGSTAETAAFELNLNTGVEMEFLAQLTPDQTQSHWFAIDRAILREHAVTLAGPAPRDVFGLIPYAVLLGALAQSLSWHARGNARSDDSVLNACRALRFARTRVWSGKEAAARWALEQGADVDTILAALRERAGGPAVGSQRATTFVETIEREIEQRKSET